MIRDLSESLRALVEDPKWKEAFPELARAQIAFDRPADDFNPAQPTIELFLFDVRENTELRSNEPMVTRLNGMVATTRPPLRVACSYLLTARPVGVTGTELALQEHRLLSQALQVFASHPTLPATCLQGRLAGQAPPLPLVTARADGLKEPVEFWAALGARMRPAVVVTATISMMPVEAPVTAHEVTATMLTVGQRAAVDRTGLTPSADPASFRIGGRVTWAADHQPVTDATVTLVERGLVAATDADGAWELGALVAGKYTIKVRRGRQARTIKAIVQGKKSPACNVELPGSAPTPKGTAR